MAYTITANPVLERLGIQPVNSGACASDWIASPGGATIGSTNPADGSELAQIHLASGDDYERVVSDATEVFQRWRMLPAPQRGQIIREIGDELRRFKDDLGTLVTLEMGKILAEGRGEVQEMIDIADFAVGLSRQLYGLTMPSERPQHRMYEQWHPLGVAGVISAFNFPVAVWSWNALIAAVCGDCVLWKPSLKTPLTAIAVQKICDRVFERHGWRGVFSLVIGEDSSVGKRLLEDRRIPLVSATGSCRMGREECFDVFFRAGVAVSAQPARQTTHCGWYVALQIRPMCLDRRPGLLACERIEFEAGEVSGKILQPDFAAERIVDRPRDQFWIAELSQRE